MRLSEQWYCPTLESREPPDEGAGVLRTSPGDSHNSTEQKQRDAKKRTLHDSICIKFTSKKKEVRARFEGASGGLVF